MRTMPVLTYQGVPVVGAPRSERLNMFMADWPAEVQADMKIYYAVPILEEEE